MMNRKLFFKIRLCFTILVTLAIGLLLLWNHYHGGVPSHHILQRKDLPEISNWWGGILLPLLSWFIFYRIQNRVVYNNESTIKSNFPTDVLYRFFGALIFGMLLSTFFTLGYSEIAGYMIEGVFIFALFFPIYRSECLLGFVIGMTYTFGAVLPTGIGSILLLICAILFLLVRPSLLFVIKKGLNLINSK